MSHRAWTDPGKRRENCWAREVAEARWPPPVSEERKRILRALGWLGGVERGRCTIFVSVVVCVAVVCVCCWGSAEDDVSS